MEIKKPEENQPKKETHKEFKLHHQIEQIAKWIRSAEHGHLGQRLRTWIHKKKN